MRTVTSVVLLFLALGTVADADEPTRTRFEDVPVIRLDSAVRKGIVEGGGEQPRSYSRVTLVLVNRTGERRVIDVAGGFLRPKTRGSCQRLGLGPAVTPRLRLRRGRGTNLIRLEPNETKKIEMHTVCLDAGRAAPSSHSFDISESELPVVRRKVMRWWADHPDTPQSAVNSAIWQNSEKVYVPKYTPRRSAPVWSKTTGHAGTVFRLRDGELLSRDPDGLVRFLGTGIRQVFPTENGVFAVAPGEDGARELWRLALTGKNPWSRVTALEEKTVVQDVFAVERSVVIVREDGIDIVRGGESRRVLKGPETGYPEITAWPVRGGRVRVVFATRGHAYTLQAGERKTGRSKTIEVSDLDPKTGKLRRLRENWNLRSAAVGPAGVYALSHGANLRCFNGKSFKVFGPNLPWKRIVAVGRKHLWVADRQENLALVSARTGSVAKRFPVRVPTAEGFTIDRATDDLLTRRGDALLRIAAATGEITKIEFGEE